MQKSDLGVLYWPNLIAALIASVGLVIGSIGPWMSFFAMSRGGMDADGTLTLILGILAAGALFAVLNLGLLGARKSNLMMWLSVAAVVAGLLGAIIAVVDIIDITSRTAEIFGETMSPEVGWGLWLVLISALALTVTAIVVAIQAGKIPANQRP